MINSDMNANHLAVIMGPNINYPHFHKNQDLFHLIGDGNSFIETHEIEKQAKYSSAIICAHGNIEHQDKKKIAVIDLIKDIDSTAQNLFLIQDNLGTRHFYLFSCHSGALPESLYKIKDVFETNTTVTIFCSAKYSLVRNFAKYTIKKLASFYNEYKNLPPQKIDEKFFAEQVLSTPLTAIRCEIKEKKGNKQLLAFKVRGPKTSFEINNFLKYDQSVNKIKFLIVENYLDAVKWSNCISPNDPSFYWKEYKNIAFIESINRNKNKRVKTWLKMGIEIDKPSPITHCSPLYFACLKGRQNAALTLIEAGAKVDTKEKKGTTPLHAACFDIGQKEVIKKLIGKGANVNTKTDDGYTPLHFACVIGDIETIQILIENNAEIDLTNNEGKTALYIASESGNIQAVQVLIDAKAKLELATNDGYTPLHIAFKKEHIEVIELLLKERKNNISKIKK